MIDNCRVPAQELRTLIYLDISVLNIKFLEVRHCFRVLSGAGLGDRVICESCKKRPVARVITREVDGEKRTTYLCDACQGAVDAEKPSRKLDRPCSVCREREGTIKLTRIRDGFRHVSHVCDACARSR